MDDDLFNVFDAEPAASSAGGDAEPASTNGETAVSRKRKSISKIAGDAAQDIADLAELEKTAAEQKKKKKLDLEKEKDVVTIEDSDEEEEAESSKQKSAEASDVAKSRLVENLSADVSALEKMPRIQIHRVETVEACLHEVAIPPGCQFSQLNPLPEKLAKEYPFILDPFQKEAILCLENLQSVLVSAHTSAGKTVVAVYAIAMSLRAKQRVIYTTPIKALSNQKYRELFEEFQDVGLMTGDVTINPSASILVMTTEILRSMLYRGSEVMREVAWVVFDEIHYMRDKERGVVWEETIILLPDTVRYVFLSATIPNARQFAEWIAHIHNQPCHVVYTETRPTPLQHYIYAAGATGTHMVVDEAGDFNEENFNEAMRELQNLPGGGGGGSQKYGQRGGRPGGGGNSNCFNVIKMVFDRDLAPVIVFSFSRKDCEAYALEVNKEDFNTEEEKKLVEEIFQSALGTLSDDDRKLPQISNVLPLLKKGIGIHHSGLLPLLKETTEILFQEGLIKMLFATETFSMGLNMPARTVVFTSARKFDGKSFRYITSGEYIQMSGRAGRRGIDERGIVIMIFDETISPAVCKQIIKGQPDPLNSAFRLTYNMILNLLRVEDINPEFMMEKSFYQFQNYSTLPEVFAKLTELDQRYSTISVDDESDVANYWQLKQQANDLKEEIRQFMRRPEYLLPFLQPGRLVHVIRGEQDFGWGPVVNFSKKQAARNEHAKPAPVDVDNPLGASGANDGPSSYIIDVLLPLDRSAVEARDIKQASPATPNRPSETVALPVTQELIVDISALRAFLPKDLRAVDARRAVTKLVNEITDKFPAGLPLIDPEEDMKIKAPKFKEAMRQLKIVESLLLRHKLTTSPKLVERLGAYEKKQKLVAEIKSVKGEVKRRCSLLHMTKLKAMKRVLRRLGFVNASDVIEVKGRVACEISCADELMMTELLLGGVFNKLSAAECAALLSCLVTEEKGTEAPKLSEALNSALRSLQDTARKIARTMVDCRAFDEDEATDEDAFVNQFRPYSMPVVHAWCQGASFLSLCEMSSFFEGSIVRCMRQLEETLREMTLAARAIGSVDLENRFAEATKLLKRDIVFAASLYL